MKKKFLINITIGVFLFFLFFKVLVPFLEYLGNKSQLKRGIEDIKSEFKGIVVEKFSYRENMPATHLKIKTKDSIKILMPFKIEYINIGDSIIKPKSENNLIVKKGDSVSLEHYYVRLSKKDRNSEKFPKEWKNKWMESTAWDSLQ